MGITKPKKKGTSVIDLEDLKNDIDNLAAVISLFYYRWLELNNIDEDHPQYKEINEISNDFFNSLPVNGINE